MNVELAIFDLGATTVVVGDDGSPSEDAETRCLRAALAQAGLLVTCEEVRATRSLSRLQALRVLVGGAPERAALRERLGALHLDAVARLLAFYRSDPALREAPGLHGALRALRRAGVRIALASPLPRETTDALLARLGWIPDGLLDATIAADEVPLAGAERGAVGALLRHFRVTAPRRAALVSDSPALLAEGASAGCGVVIALGRDAGARRELAHARCTRHASSLAEVAEQLGAPAG